MNLPGFRRKSTELVERSDPGLALQEYITLLNQFGYQGVTYTVPGDQQEEITGGNFQHLTRAAYKANGVVFACMLTRQMIFTEARFQFRERRNGRPGKLYGNDTLSILEHPWPGATTGNLLARAIQYGDLAGNAFFTRRGPWIRCMRPDWVTLILGSYEDPDVAAWDLDADVLGYIYKPGGKYSQRPAEILRADEVAHYCPIPDPEAQYRGMSWLTPIVREIMADKAMTEHKLKFMENAATPNMVVKLAVEDLKVFQEWMDDFKGRYEGAANAYKTMFLGAGADATVVGANLKELEFKISQGAGETRIAAAAKTPPVVVGLSEGLQAATYSNYGQARRHFADGTMRPLWREIAGSLQTIVPAPSGSELWYDDRDIPFLQEDQKDAAEITKEKMIAVRTAVDGGFTAESAVAAVDANDLTLLSHTGLLSVQLQPPGTVFKPAGTSTTPPPSSTTTNGKTTQGATP